VAMPLKEKTRKLPTYVEMDYVEVPHDTLENITM